jgi:integrase
MVRYWEHHGRTRFATDVIRQTIRLVATRLPCLPLDQLTIPRQEQLIEGLSPGTARRYLAVVRAALEWAAARQEIERAPRIKRLEVEDGPGALPYSLDELRRLLEAARAEHERRLLVLLLSTGARPQAVLQLTWDRIKDGVANFHVPGRRRTKKRRARAPLPPSVASWLETRRGLGPVVQWADRAMAGHRMTFERIAARAGVVGTAYGMRKALATWLRQQNVPEWEVGALLGHRVSSATTERYAHHRPDYMAATVAAVEALLAEIRPTWLDTAETVERGAPAGGLRIRMVSNGLSGSREWDRTTDHFHVKEATPYILQRLEPANDD